ncbi:Bug family tripartite tricarboxylate transporter substrate binding protein [Enterovirga rhinocerotis]|uniref:Tripartite-type tricarboxylate transporter receptor subunit TctC n=1 Tax=Enterovirga rhinocerotis TaxID=1339210 RepID=A0A4R7BWH2_9HYPH|nr:tripartite tricarboxylate transporter substrate binding protein [Enterovirga rhinocerotis]TDR90214.1 tripartite-type tricarboxylate transporter receptor subunit TctC [Enterovirga rhinocerotis]
MIVVGTRRAAFAVVAGMAALVAVPDIAQADDAVAAFPSRFVRLVVGQAPGGTTDVIARAMATRLSERWKQNVIVENMAGASGNLGAQNVARAEPDGYTLLMTYEGSQAMNPHVLPTTAFDAVKDFSPIATVARAGFLLIASPKTGIEDFATLVKRARAAPATLTYGSAGAGSANHLIGEMLQSKAGIRLRHVPYRGAPQATTDLIAGQIDLAVVSIPSIMGQVAAGTVRALAVTSAERSSALPDVPTAAEAGVAGFAVTPWWGILAPAKADPALVRKIADDINAILAEDSIKATFGKLGAEVFVTTSAQFGELMAEDVRKWGVTVKEIGLK